MSFAFRCVFLALLLLAPTVPASANQVNAIISQYSAAEFASAAATFTQRYPDRTARARPPKHLHALDAPGGGHPLAPRPPLPPAGVVGRGHGLEGGAAKGSLVAVEPGVAPDRGPLRQQRHRRPA